MSLEDLVQAANPDGEYVKELAKWRATMKGKDSHTRAHVTSALRSLSRGGVKTLEDLRNSPKDKLLLLKGLNDRSIGFVQAVFGASARNSSQGK